MVRGGALEAPPEGLAEGALPEARFVRDLASLELKTGLVLGRIPKAMFDQG